MNYKEKYLKYKQKYKTIKYGGSKGNVYKKTFQVTQPRRKTFVADPGQESVNLEDYKKTMQLFYDLSQLNLEAEKLHQEILKAGFPFMLIYESWTWTKADNDQFADMNMGKNKSTKDGSQQKPEKIIKKSNVKFGFFTLGSNHAGPTYASYWFHSYKPNDTKEFEFIEKMKAHHNKVKDFLCRYEIDISRFYPEIASDGKYTNDYLLGVDDYSLEVDNKKIHILPHYVYYDDRYWNETQSEWLRKLNNFFIYERKKELYESYCNLRSCYTDDFIEE